LKHFPDLPQAPSGRGKLACAPVCQPFHAHLHGQGGAGGGREGQRDRRRDQQQWRAASVIRTISVGTSGSVIRNRVVRWFMRGVNKAGK
jgi:hypothetical protein